MHVHAALACAHAHGTVSALRIAEHILQAFFDNMGMDADTLEVPEPSQWTHDSLLGSRSRLAVMDPMAYPMADGALSALDACDPWYHCGGYAVRRSACVFEASFMVWGFWCLPVWL